VDVIVSEYCFAIYPIVGKLFGANVITVPAKNYGHDLPAMLKAITPNTKVIFVANPNNPTGTLAPREDVVHLINNVPKNILLVMDEAYFEFLNDPVDLLPLIRNGIKPNLLLMRTFSKIFGLAGLRLGYGIAVPELITALEKIRQPFNINSIAQAAALAALDDDEHLQKTRTNNFAGLRFLENQLQKLKLEFVLSSANLILTRVGDGQKIFNDLQKLGVITRPMGGYGLLEWIRISIGIPAENERCIEALKSVLGANPKSN
jgi:histidinol-phosphate aminotransferase